jgi:peptidoglycan-N-acetylglucosamine deacetylase
LKNKRIPVLFTNDVETTSILNGFLSDETGRLILQEGMPLLLDLYDKYEVKATFFYTGYIAKLYPDLVKMAFQRGHEIGCHGLTHHSQRAFDVLTLYEQVKQLQEAKAILENITGNEIHAFRAPALRVNHNTPVALHEAGFTIDSSISSQRFDMFLSHGSTRKIKWFTAPRYPYRTDENNLYKKGDGNIIEVPISAIFIPYIGTIMRILPAIAILLRKSLIMESRITRKPINFLIHPNEFLEEELDQTRSIEKRSSNLITYFLADYLRHRLKIKNLGKKAVKLYEKELKALSKEKFECLTISEYVKKMEL